MSHDWIEELNLQVRQYLDRSLDEIPPPDPPVKPFNPEAMPTTDLIEHWQSILHEALAQDRRREDKMINEAAIQARELGCGLVVTVSDHQVHGVNPSSHVLAGQAYLVSSDALTVVYDRAESGPPLWSLEAPVID